MTAGPRQKRADRHETPERVAFLLCGGRGTRLKRITDRPKALLQVAGWPFLRYHLELLGTARFDRTVLLTGYRGEEIEETFGPAGPTRLFVREASPQGTGGALARARRHAGMVNWIANGDSFADIEVEALLSSHRPGAGTILAVRMEDRADYGGLAIEADGRIIRFIEKGTHEPGWINAGIYILDHSLLTELPIGISSLERDHFPRWAESGKLFAHKTEAFFRDIGTPERLEAAQAEFVPIRSRLGARGGETAR